MRGIATGLVLIAALCVPLYFLAVNLPSIIGLRLPVDRDSVVAIGLVNDPDFEPTLTPGVPRFSPLESSLPPTLTAPTRTIAVASPLAIATGERVVITNTGGIGAAVRAEPRIGGQIAGMQEGEVADVLERRTVDGTEWIRVRTPRGQEGWILGLASERLGPGTPVPVRLTRGSPVTPTAAPPVEPTPVASDSSPGTESAEDPPATDAEPSN